MPGVLLDMEPEEVPAPKVPEYGFIVSHQKVELEVDFSTQSLKGHTVITILPQTKNLREIKIDARQMHIPENKVTVDGILADADYEDPMTALDIPKHIVWGAGQYRLQRERLKPLTEDRRADGPLWITIPESVRVEEVDPFSERAASAVTQQALGASAARNSSIAVDGSGLLGTPMMTPKTAAESSARFQPLRIGIPFSASNFRDGLHFVGLTEGDKRFPHVYTKHSMDPGTASCIFPCIDDPAMRCTWEIHIKCSRTLGDALKRKPAPRNYKMLHPKKAVTNGVTNRVMPPEEYDVPLSDEEKLLDMTVVCSGEITDDKVDEDDNSKKIVSFLCSTVVAPQHVGFAIGPFEQVELSKFRENEDEEKLGQGQALPIYGYCLPGRAEEIEHTCVPVAHALDWFTLTFGAYPFTQYSMVFVDDQLRDTQHTASLSLCSTRLLYPKDIIEPQFDVSRTILHAIASQWIGVSLVPNQRTDRWLTIGLSHFIAGLHIKLLCGNNEYFFHQKTLTDRLVKQDVERPSLHALGETLHLGSFEMDFMELKAPLVLFILDKRLIKASGTAGLTRIISKIITGANIGTAADSVLSTEGFRRTCEKITRYRQTEAFWNQWILSAGCPKFEITQRFNKKRLCVEMTISQIQQEPQAGRKLEKASFMRELKEDLHGIYAGTFQPVFTGPMTIRIHEADGTPYEHIIDIRERSAKYEIPYNTKYKRLKRSRRQKERLNAGAPDVDGGDDALYYCLGDVLQTPKEVKDWGLADWDKNTEERMDQESYEWIRIDADFEWLCDKRFGGMPSYMYVSQLQQDRDVVAQQESMLWLKETSAHPLVSTFLVRTLMDGRYFHGIRTLAAECLKTHAVKSLDIDWIGMKHLEKGFQDFYCYPDSMTPRPNDFEDRRAYLVEKAITKSVALIRDRKGECPRRARQFILDQLRFNDNSNNEYSDNFKIANLLSALADSLIPTRPPKFYTDQSYKPANEEGEDEDEDEPLRFRMAALEELERYRRMEEFTGSYHNIFTVTVLDCKQRLMKAKVIPLNPRDFAQYLHDGTSDFVRIKAFEALVDLGFMTTNGVLKLLLNMLSTDPSPYVRSHLFEVFCLGLAAVAFAEGKFDPPPPVKEEDAEDSLIVEQEASTAPRKDMHVRTTSMEGALNALKDELMGNTVLKGALWKAIESTIITLPEQWDLLDICGILYKAVVSMIVKLKKPRYWEAKRLGKACFCIALLIFRMLTNLCRVSCISRKQGSSANQRGRLS